MYISYETLQFITHLFDTYNLDRNFRVGIFCTNEEDFRRFETIITDLIHPKDETKSYHEDYRVLYKNSNIEIFIYKHENICANFPRLNFAIADVNYPFSMLHEMLEPAVNWHPSLGLQYFTSYSVKKWVDDFHKKEKKLTRSGCGILDDYREHDPNDINEIILPVLEKQKEDENGNKKFN